MTGSTSLCAVYGCCNTLRNTAYSKPLVSFYAFLGRLWESGRKSLWINFCKRKNADGSKWNPTKYSTICSQHFVGNEKSQHPLNPAFNPSIYCSDLKLGTARSNHRHARYKTRSKTQEAKVTNNLDVTPIDVFEPSFCEIGCQTNEHLTFGELQIFLSATVNGESSTQVCHKEINAVSTMTEALSVKSVSPGSDTRTLVFCGSSSVLAEPQALQDLTSVSKNVFSLLLNLLPPTTLRNREVTAEDRLLICLMKLKLGMCNNIT